MSHEYTNLLNWIIAFGVINALLSGIAIARISKLAKKN